MLYLHFMLICGFKNITYEKNFISINLPFNSIFI